MSISNIWRRLKFALMTVSYSIAVILGVFSPSIASADALIAYGGSSVTGAVEEAISLPGITVSGSDPSIPMSVSIDDGILYMDDMTGLTFSSSTRASTLSFSGNVTDINNALATLKYRTIDAGAKTLTATILGDGVVFFPENGHLYEVVNNGSSLSWDDAVVAAAGRTLNGATGYLATVTTQAENDYLVSRLSGDGWFGASDVGSEGDWKWVTGPEAGTSFWAGNESGAPVESRFANWAGSEPNDYSPGEDCAQFYSDGSGWNDLPCGGPYLNYYVVEYGAPDDVPTAPEDITFTVNVTAPTAAEIPISSCLDLIDVYDNGIDNRYDNLSLTNDVDCDGEVLNPLFGQEDTDFGVIGFRGSLDGNGHTLSNISVDFPSDTNIGLFAATDNAEITDITVNGSVAGNTCVGGLVGHAVNTDFTSVFLGVNVSGYQQVGGYVGCNESSSNASSSITNSSSSGEIYADYGVSGGFIGIQRSNDDSSFTISDSEFEGSVDSGSWGSGGLIAELYVNDTGSLTIESNTVGEVNVPNANSIGGIVGYAEIDGSGTALIQDNTLLTSVTGASYVGGVVGEGYNYTSSINNFLIQNQEIRADITSTDGDSVGGVVGYGEYMQLENVVVDATISGYDDEVGGLFGESYNNTIIESSSAGTVEASDSFVGGLVGRNSETTIRRSFSTADVVGDDRVGGLVGANGGYIYDSYARGDVTGVSQVGGVAGRCGREITNAYATGLVTGDSDTGGLVGYNDGCDVVDSFWDTETSMQAESSGDETGKTTAEMKLLLTFTDTESVGLTDAWDYESVWAQYADKNDGYPCLQWQDENCTNTESPEEPADNDGIETETEDAAPNGGDANNDGTQDSEQNNVSSFINPVSTQYAVVKVDAACALSEVSAEQESAQIVADSGYNYSSGLVRFTANCGTPGYSTTAQVIVYGASAADLTLRKYNPNTKAYFTINNATIVDTVIGGKKAAIATYQISDGGLLDTDGTSNGVIVDPVGLASLVVGVPNTGFQR